MNIHVAALRDFSQGTAGMLDSEGIIDLGGRRDLYRRLPQATMFLP